MAKQYGQTRLCYVQVITKRQRKPVKSKVVDIDVSAVGQKGQNVRWPHSPLVLPHDESLEAYTVIIALTLEKVDTDRQTDRVRRTDAKSALCGFHYERGQSDNMQLQTRGLF